MKAAPDLPAHSDLQTTVEYARIKGSIVVAVIRVPDPNRAGEGADKVFQRIYDRAV